MTTLTENPMPLIFFAVAVEAVLGVILYMTGRGIYLIAMIGVLLAILGCVGLERMIVTERERVEAALEEVRAGMEANDIERVLACISPQAGDVRSDARWAISYVRFTRVKITRLEIDKINKLTSPPTATARFIVMVSGEDRHGSMGHRTYPAKLDVTFRLENGRWVIIKHKWYNDIR